MKIGGYTTMSPTEGTADTSFVASPCKAKTVFSDGSHSGGCTIYGNNQEILSARRAAWRKHQGLENDPLYLIPLGMYRLAQYVCRGIGWGISALWQHRAEEAPEIVQSEPVDPYGIVQEALDMTVKEEVVAPETVSAVQVGERMKLGGVRLGMVGSVSQQYAPAHAILRGIRV